MAYRRRTSGRGKKGGLNLRTASLATLQQALTAAKDRLESLESSAKAPLESLRASMAEWQLNNYGTPTQLKLNMSELAVIDEKMKRLRTMRQPKKGLLAGIFGWADQSPEVKSAISSLGSRQSELWRQESELRTRLRECEWLKREIQSLIEPIEHARSWISKLTEVIGQKQRKEDRL